MTERKPYADSQHWYSKLKTFDTCARMYKLQHIDKVPVPEEKSADLSFGTAFHAAINYHLDTRDSGIPVFNRMWELAKEEGLEYGRWKHAELHAIADILLQRFERLHSKHFKPKLMEERIFHPALPFEGSPDFLGEYKGVPSIVDWKTSGSRYHNLRVISDDQLDAYALLADTIGYEVKQKCYVVFIKDLKAPSIQVLTAPISATSIAETAANVEDKISEVEDSSYPKNRSSCIQGARVCKYWEHCFGPKPKKGDDEAAGSD